MAKGKQIEAGRGFVTLDVRDRLQRGLRRASARLKAFGSQTRAVGTSIAGAGLAIVAPILAATKVFTGLGDQIQKTAARTGIGAEAVSELGFAAEQSGTDLATLEKGVRGMNRTLFDLERGLSTSKDSFGALNLTLDDFRGLNVEQRFGLIADRLSQIEDPSKRSAIAMKIFGRAGTELLPLLNNGSKGIEQMRERARELGLTVGGDAANNAARLTDKLNELWRQVKQVAFTIGAAVADDLIAFIKTLSPILRSVIDWIKQNRTLISVVFRLGAALVAAGTALAAIGTLISAAGAALGVLAPIVGFLISPIGLIGAGLAVAAVAFFRFSDAGRKALASIVEALKPLVAIFKRTFQGIFDAIAGGDFLLAGRIAIAGLKAAFVRGLADLSSLVGGSLGDLLGSLVGQLAAGDLAGAWETVVLKLAAIWDGFAEGVVAVFTQAARAITDLWQRTTTSIADGILALAAQGGIVGDVFSKVVGVDLNAEQAQLEQQQRAQIDNLKRTAERYREIAAEAEAAGDVDTAERFRANLADVERRLAELNATAPDFLADTQRDAAAQLDSAGDAIRDKLDAADRAAQQRAAASRQAIAERTEGGVDDAAEAAEAANAELDALLAEAKEKRETAEAERKRQMDDAANGAGFSLDDLAGGGAEGAAETARGTFSGAAAQLIAGTRRPAEERIARIENLVGAIRGDAAKIAKAAKTGLAFA